MDKWLLKLNINKCTVVSYGHHIEIINDYYLPTDGSMSLLEHLDLITDLGVTFDSKLKLGHHINEKVIKLIQFWVFYIEISNICRLINL